MTSSGFKTSRSPFLIVTLALWLASAAPLHAAGAPGTPATATTIDLPDGGRYRGPLRHGKLHGQGRIDWGKGRWYQGGFVNGFMHGQGRIVDPAYRYEGQMKRGAMNGHGKLKRPDGVVYQGQFVDNRMQGRGKLSFGEGTLFEGQFKNDQPSGQGRMTYANGMAIESVFEGYQPTGPGVVTWKSGDRYEGPLMGGTPHGDGVLTRADKAVIRGKFSYGSVESPARIEFADGAVYIGEVEGNRAHGKGELRRANGELLKGRFAAGEPDGQGVLMRDDGTQQAGYWRAGKYLGEAGDGTLDDTREVAARNNELTLYNQHALLQRQFEQLKASEPGVPRLYTLYVAGDGRQEVFRREVTFVDELMARRFDTRGRSVSLVNSRSSAERLPLATAHSIELALAALAGKMDRERDLLFVYLTSHGSSTHELSLGAKGLMLPDLPAARLGELLKASGIRNQVVVVSACYAGGFIPALQGERTWVIASAQADRRSFGCADDNDFTYFGRALFKESLSEAVTLTDAFQRAQKLVQEWEARDAATRAKQAEAAAAQAKPEAAKAMAAKLAEAEKAERSEPQSVVSPAFQAEVDAWLRGLAQRPN
ncbi:C13 family peptidase [Ottowia testudinis]|uniref:Peptidase C13 n=1 Tax=Ottowia testudinis TaxID=2816950 RepID=A0A975CJP8_9BURK|nr:C13 family peptidase [Ottowia testudinis]QTD46331.1 hypothetical protein J1M35_05405 [Ottowia testudinis]